MNKKLTKLLSVFIIAGAIGVGAAFTATGCKNNDGGQNQVQTPTVTGVTVTGSTTVANGGSVQLTATVNGDNSPSQEVTWKIKEGATATGATVSSTGLVSAGTVAGKVTVIATSVADATKSGEIEITVQAAAVAQPTVTSVTASADKTTGTVGDKITLTATVVGDNNPSQEVTWAITEGGDYATLSGNELMLTAAGTVKVQATSVADATKSGEIEITVQAAAVARPTVTGVTASADKTTGTVGDNITLTATVAGTNNPSQEVTWAITEGGDYATLSGNELMLTAAGTVKVQATSVEDTNKKSDVLTITVQAAAVAQPTVTGVTASADKTTGTVGDKITLTAAVVGDNNPSQEVTWAITEGGDYATLSGNELTLTAAGTVKVQATSVADTNKKSDVLTITVQAAAVAQPTVTSVTASADKTTGTVGDNITLTATVVGDNNPSQEVTWAITEGGDYATLSGNELTLTAAGTVKVQATSVADTIKKSDVLTITVQAASQPVDPEPDNPDDPVVEKYTVTFNANGHGTAPAAAETTDKKVAAPTDPAADGYTFGGWYATAECTGTAFDFDAELSADTTLYAKWTAIEYTITFKNSDGTVDTVKYTIENKQITVPDVPEKTGYEGAWSTYDLDDLGDKEVNAVYTAIEYTITYAGVDGATNANPAKYTIETDTIELEEPTKSGYTFLGWYKDGEETTEIANGSTGDITLTAKWQAAKLSFEAWSAAIQATVESTDYTLIAKDKEKDEDGNLVDVVMFKFDTTHNTVMMMEMVELYFSFDQDGTMWQYWQDEDGTWYKVKEEDKPEGLENVKSAADFAAAYMEMTAMEDFVAQEVYDALEFDADTGIYSYSVDDTQKIRLTIEDGKVALYIMEMAFESDDGVITNTYTYKFTDYGSTVVELPDNAVEYVPSQYEILSGSENVLYNDDFDDYSAGYIISSTENLFGIYADKQTEAEHFAVDEDGKLTQTTNGVTNSGISIPFGAPKGNVEGYFEVSVDKIGSKWGLIQFCNSSGTVISIGTGADDGKDKWSYMLKGETAYTSTVETFAADTVYKVYYTYDVETGALTVTVNDAEIFNGTVETGVNRIYLVSSNNGGRKITLDNIVTVAEQMTAGEYYETAIAALNARFAKEYILDDVYDEEGNLTQEANYSIFKEEISRTYAEYVTGYTDESGNTSTAYLAVYAPGGDLADWDIQDLLRQIEELFERLSEYDSDTVVLAARESAKDSVQSYYDEIKGDYTVNAEALENTLNDILSNIENTRYVESLDDYVDGYYTTVFDEATGEPVFDEETGEPIEKYVSREEYLAELFEYVSDDVTVWGEELESAKQQAEEELGEGLADIEGYSDLIGLKDSEGATEAQTAAIAEIENIIAQAKADIANVTEPTADAASNVSAIVTQAQTAIKTQIAAASQDIGNVKNAAINELDTYVATIVDSLDNETDAQLISDIKGAVDNAQAAINAIEISEEGEYATFDDAQAAINQTVADAKATIDGLVLADQKTKAKAELETYTDGYVSQLSEAHDSITSAQEAGEAAIDEAADVSAVSETLAEAKLNVVKAYGQAIMDEYVAGVIAGIHEHDASITIQEPDSIDMSTATNESEVLALYEDAKNDFDSYVAGVLDTVEYTVTFTCGEEEQTQTVKYGKAIDQSQITDPTAESQTEMLKGWKVDGADFDLKTAIYGDVTLTAVVVDAIYHEAVTESFNWKSITATTEGELADQKAPVLEGENAFITALAGLQYRTATDASLVTTGGIIQGVANNEAFSVTFTNSGTLTVSVRGGGNTTTTTFYLQDSAGNKIAATLNATPNSASSSFSEVDNVYTMYSKAYEVYTFTITEAGTYTFVVGEKTCRFGSIVQITDGYKTEKIAVESVTISGENTVEVGKDVQLSAVLTPDEASIKDVTWSVTDGDDGGSATISEDGLLTGVAAGTVTVTVTADGGKTATITVTVTKVNVTSVTISREDGEEIGEDGISISTGTIQLGATVLPEDASLPEVEWKSSNGEVVTVDGNGLVTYVGVGTATVTATADGVSGSVTITCTATPVTGVTISGESEVDAGDSIQLTAVIAPAEASDQTVTWSVADGEDGGSATISEDGVLTGVKVGTVTVTVTTNDGGHTATHTVTVNKVAVTAVTVSGKDVVEVGKTITLEATVTPNNATDKTVTWSSSDINLATVDENGVVTGVAVGSVTITATVDGVASEGFGVTINEAATLTTVGFSEATSEVVTAIQDSVTAGVYYDEYNILDFVYDSTSGISLETANGDTHVKYAGALKSAARYIKIDLSGYTGTATVSFTVYSGSAGRSMYLTTASGINSTTNANVLENSVATPEAKGTASITDYELECGNVYYICTDNTVSLSALTVTLDVSKKA